MRFSFTDEQGMMRSSFRELLQNSSTPAMLRAAWTSETGRIPGLWARLAEFGALGLIAPESQGGTGLSEIELAVLLEESGRAALPEPLLETAAAVVPLLVSFASDERARAILERVTTGAAVVGVGWQGRPYVVNADSCDAFLLQREDSLHLVARDAVDLGRQESVDRSRRLFRVAFGPERATVLAQGRAAIGVLAEARDRAALAAAAELVGLGSRLLEMAVEYARTREQFGQPIGSFQAVKHLLVNAHLGITFARPLVYRAAHSFAHREPARSLHVSSAKASASDAAWQAARAALQVHGAIGYSYEHDLHLWMKRVWALAADHGDATWHRARVASSIVGE